MNFDDIPETTPSAPPSFDSLPDESKQMGNMATDVFPEIKRAGSSAVSGINEAFNPSSQTNTQIAEQEKNAPIWDISGELSRVGSVGRGLASIPALVGSPITGAARSLIGHPLAAATPQGYYGPDVTTPEQIYEKAKGEADLAMSALAPGRGGLRAPVPLPPAPTPGPLGVTLSEGQETGALPAIQREQAALRGTSGPQAQTRAQAFADQQKAQVETAKDIVSRALDPFGMQVAESPQEAGAAISQGLQSTAAAKKAAVTQAYDDARSYPGEIHADVFRDMGQGIRNDLSSAAQPVIVDDKLTPFASKMTGELDDFISKPAIQNKADPLGPPDPSTITGVNLSGVDQMRKRLVAFKQGAWGNNGADGRAASAILDSFDNRVDQAINGGQFNGDPRAIQAWNDARAAYSDYRGNFTAAKNDPVGRVVEKIIGKNSIGPTPAGPAIPNDVADYLYGAAGTNPSSLNVGVANRIKSLLGDQSPEWSAVKQGLFRRLVEPGEGMTGWGPGKVAQRVNDFLNVNGREMSQALFSPNERALLQNYADMMRKLEVPQSGANWSNTATFMARTVNGIGSRVGMLVGAGLGRAAMPWAPPLVAEGLGAGAAGLAAKSAQALQARAVARQMTLVAEQVQKWQKALQAAQRANTPPSRAAATAATLNLSRTLAPLGIDLRQLTGPTAAYSGQNQQNTPRPPNQQQNGGAVQQQRATGGKVGESHKAKATKTEAHYRGGSEKARCGICTMFEAPHGCSAVRGEISPRGLCDLYKRKESREAA